LSQWARDKAGTFLFGMLALQTYTYEENMMAGGNLTEDALEAKQRDCRPIEFGFFQKARSPGVYEGVERRVAAATRGHVVAGQRANALVDRHPRR